MKRANKKIGVLVLTGLLVLTLASCSNLLQELGRTTTWNQTLTAAAGASSFNGVSIDGSGTIHVSGRLLSAGSYTFGNDISVTAANPSPVFIQYSAAGVPVSATQAVTVNQTAGSLWIADMITDSSGNLYAAANLTGDSSNATTFDFGSGVTIAVDTTKRSQPLVLKYNAAGAVLWAKAVVPSDNNNNLIYSLTLDSSGNMYVVGLFHSGTLDFGNGVSISNARDPISQCYMVAKYSSDGLAQWAKTMDSVGTNQISTQGLGVAADITGNVYVQGLIASATAGQNTVGFGNGKTVTINYAENNLFLAAFNTAGETQWVKKSMVDPLGGAYPSKLATDGTNLYALLMLYKNIEYDFGNSVKATGLVDLSQPSNAVLVKHDQAGVAQWAVSAQSGTGMTRFNKIALDAGGNVYVAGEIGGDGQFDFGGTTVQGPYAGTSNDGINALFLKITPAGSVQQVRTTLSGTNNSSFTGVAVGGAGDIYVTGYISGTAPFAFESGATVQGIFDGYNGLLLKF